jgi:hypothetical protein
MTKKQRIRRIILYSIVIVLPYLLAWLLQGTGYRFSGLLLNPIDGYSYFAKMEQGYNGDWLFRLPFTAQPGNGVVLFEFYLLLGHISRISRLSIPLVFHLARIGAAILLLIQVDKFIYQYFQFHYLKHELVYDFVLLSSGVGWIALVMQYKSADFWVAEGYPFYSALISPHFTLGIFLFLFILTKIPQDNTLIARVILFLAATALALTMPFGSVILVILLGGVWMFDAEWRKRNQFIQILLVVIPSIILVGGQYAQTLHSPQLQIWNQQNITATPPLWDLLISFSPMILFAFVSLIAIHKYWNNPGYRLVMIWFVICLGMVLLPFSLQRRFLFCFSIPVTLLGLFSLDELIGKFKFGNFVQKVAFTLPIITIVMLIILMGFGILQKTSYVYLTTAEIEAYHWLDEYPGNDSVLLSDELHALRIPAITGKLVFYGHPYETVNAAEKLNQLLALINCENLTEDSADSFLQTQSIDLVLLPNDIYEIASCLHQYPIAKENQEFTLFAVGK